MTRMESVKELVEGLGFDHETGLRLGQTQKSLLAWQRCHWVGVMSDGMSSDEIEDDWVDKAPVWNRACGKCSLCCRLLGVKELEKPKNVLCKHCKGNGGGCGIYDARPEVCRKWFCQWLANSEFGDDWYPLKCGMVVHKTVEVSIGGRVTYRLTVDVDPDKPEVWRKKPYRDGIWRMAQTGIEGRFGLRFQTTVAIGRRQWWILPNEDGSVEEVELREGVITVPVKVGGGWQIREFSDAEGAREFIRENEERLVGA